MQCRVTIWCANRVGISFLFFAQLVKKSNNVVLNVEVSKLSSGLHQ